MRSDQRNKAIALSREESEFKTPPPLVTGFFSKPHTCVKTKLYHLKLYHLIKLSFNMVLESPFRYNTEHEPPYTVLTHYSGRVRNFP